MVGVEHGGGRAMKEPVDHIERPRLPWRGGDGAITECGYDASKVKTLTRPEFIARLREFGAQRTALLTCMTCSDTARRWGTWDDDPRQALEREILWEHGGRWRAREDRGDMLLFELQAAAALIAAHRAEFDATVDALRQRRDWLAKKDARSRKSTGREP